jgi:uncharacterized OB-fold protein
MAEAVKQPEVRRPVLEQGPTTRPFWEAARRRELALQHCLSCGRLHHPPVPLCPDCHGDEFDFKAVGTTGTVYEFSIMREPRVIGFEAMVPYACLLVELDEQPGLFVIGNLVDAEADAVRVGMRVQLRFEPYGLDDLLLPQWGPLDGEVSP